MCKHKPDRKSGNIVLVVQFDCLDLHGGGSLEGNIFGIHEAENVRQQNFEIDSISVVDKGVKNILYHCRVSFDSSGWSASEDEEKIHALDVFEQSKTTICRFVDFFAQFLIFTSDAIFLGGIYCSLKSFLVVQDLLCFIQDSFDLIMEQFFELIHSLLFFDLLGKFDLVHLRQRNSSAVSSH